MIDRRGCRCVMGGGRRVMFRRRFLLRVVVVEPPGSADNALVLGCEVIEEAAREI